MATNLQVFEACRNWKWFKGDGKVEASLHELCDTLRNAPVSQLDIKRVKLEYEELSPKDALGSLFAEVAFRLQVHMAQKQGLLCSCHPLCTDESVTGGESDDESDNDTASTCACSGGCAE